MEVGGRGGLNKSTELDGFVRDVEFIKEDINAMEKTYKKLQESNEESKTIHGLIGMQDLRASMDADVDHVLKLAKVIMKRLEGLERSMNVGKLSGIGSSIDRTRMTVVMGLGKRLRDVMDEFQGLRVKIAAVHKEAVELRYYTITGEKQFVETIEGLVSSREIEAFLAEAVEEQGSGRVLEVVQEIQERRDGVKHIQKCLTDLHQILLDTVGLAESQGQKMGSNDNDNNNNIRTGTGMGMGMGMGGKENSFARPAMARLHDPQDYEKDARKRATIALVLVIALMLILIVPLFNMESKVNNNE